MKENQEETRVTVYTSDVKELVMENYELEQVKDKTTVIPLLPLLHLSLGNQ